METYVKFKFNGFGIQSPKGKTLPIAEGRFNLGSIEKPDYHQVSLWPSTTYGNTMRNGATDDLPFCLQISPNNQQDNTANKGAATQAIAAAFNAFKPQVPQAPQVKVAAASTTTPAPLEDEIPF